MIVDWSAFNRSRAGRWGWILTPLLLVALVHIGALAYERNAIRTLHETRSLHALLPELEATAEAAEKILDRYASRPVAEAEEMGKAFARMAVEAGVVIDELAIQETDAASADLRKLTFTVLGAGRLPDTLRFLAEVQYDGRLLEVTQASLRQSDVGEGAFFESRLVVTYRALVRADPAAGEGAP